MSFQADSIPYPPVFIHGTLRPGQLNDGLLRGFTVAEEPAHLSHMDLFALSFHPMALPESQRAAQSLPSRQWLDGV